MALIVFTKALQEKSIAELVPIAQEYGIDGFDLCVRPGHPVNPDNIAAALPLAVKLLRAEGLDAPMLSGNFDLLFADHPTAEPIAATMAACGVSLLKISYFPMDPAKHDYWTEVAKVRKGFDGWQNLARKHGIKVVYHTHAGQLGSSGASMADLTQGFDPRYIGAYIDAAHLALEGERFGVAASMVKNHLAVVGVKDFLYERQELNGHGVMTFKWVLAGTGCVDWTAVFATLRRINFNGTLSASAHFHVTKEQYLPTLKAEMAFYRRMLAQGQQPA